MKSRALFNARVSFTHIEKLSHLRKRKAYRKLVTAQRNVASLSFQFHYSHSFSLTLLSSWKLNLLMLISTTMQTTLNKRKLVVKQTNKQLARNEG